MEATGKTSDLSRDLRNILKEIDGKVSVSELLDKFDKLSEQKLVELLSGMEKDGYVREFVGKQDEGPRTPAGRSSGPPSLGAGSDLDFTAFTPAKPNAKENEDARLQAQAQEIARQAQAMRAREDATAKALKARAEATAAARAKVDAEQRAKQAAVTRTGSNTPLPPLLNPTVMPTGAPPVAGILGAGPEAQARAQADAQARTQAEALERARRDAEQKARRDAEEKARHEAEARARAEVEAAIKREAEERALKEIQERTRREEAERARREAEARAKLEAEQRARREAEERQRRELEERTRREVEERLRREEAERRRREEEERARRVEAETKARVDAELRAKRDAEDRVRREDEERRTSEKRKRAEDEQRRHQEAEQAAALERALREEQEKAAHEAEEQARREADERQEPILEDDDEERQRREEEERYAKEEEKRAREEEKAAAKAAAKARRAERARERAGEEAWRGDDEALLRETEESMSAAEAWERRKPRSFLKTLAAMVVILLVVGVAVLPFVPLETAPYEKAAQTWLGLPVKIGSVNITYFPLPQLKFEKVAIGRDPQMRAAVIKASADLGTVLGDRVRVETLAMENVIVPKEFLAALLLDKAAGRGLGVQRITAKGLKVDAPELGLPGLDLDATLSRDGTLASASLSNGGQLSVRLEPKGGKAAIEISAATLPIPIGVDFGLSDFSAKGVASASDLSLTSVEGRAFGGRLFGSARLRWSSGWSLDADLSARQMDAAKLAGPLVGSGTLQGSSRVSMRGLLPERMVLNFQADGNFSVLKGSISNVDMPRLLQGSGSGGGTTLFQDLNGDFSADPNRVLVRNLRLAAGLLSGQGQIEMDPQTNLAGRMQIELRAQSVQARSTLGVSGTLNNPQFRRTN